MARKVRTSTQTGLELATGMPVDKSGWCEKCQKRLGEFTNEAGFWVSSCPVCGFGATVPVSGGAVELKVPQHCRSFYQTKVLCKSPVIVRLDCPECLRHHSVRLSDEQGARCTWES